MSQKFPVWVVRPKLRISELWSSGVWGLTLKGPNGVWSKAPENFGSLGLTKIFISNSIFRVNIGLLSKFTFSMLKVTKYLLSNFHFDRPGIKINNFSIVTSIGPKYCCTQLSCTKNSFGEI